MKDYIKQFFENAGVNFPNENSLGEKIIPDNDPVKLANFWNWFGDSKIVDEQGRPLVVYHGTQAEFNSFKPAKRGIYFANLKRKEEVAGYYAQDKGKILACYLKIENPFIGNPTEVYEIKEKKENNEKINCDGLISINDFKKNNKFYNYQTDKLEEITLEIGDIVEIVAFEPKQIKSVNNNGLFSSASNNIYESIQEDKKYQLNDNFWDWFGNSKTIKDGSPMIFYHGTPNEFSVFDITKSSPYGNVGRGFYFTDTFETAQNYIGGLLGRKTEKSHVKECYLRMENPYDFDEIITDNEIISLANLIENNNDSFWFNKILEDINYRYSRKSLPVGWDFDEGMLVPFDRITKDGLSDAITWLYNKKILMTNQLTRDNVWFVVTDGYHTNKSKEYLKEWLLENGYDSVIFSIVGDNKGHGTYTNKCYVVFNSNQIKSVDNKGLYSIENDDIYESIEYAEMLKDGNMFEVHKNPSDKEFWDLMRNSHSKMLRVFVGAKDCYVWDGYDRTHDEIDFHLNDYFSNHVYEYAQVYCYPTWISESEFNKHHLYPWFIEKYYADVTFKEPEKKPAYVLQDKPNDNINWDEVFNELEELDKSLLKEDIVYQKTKLKKLLTN